MKEKNRNIGEELLGGLEDLLAYKQGKLTLRQYSASLSEEPEISAAEIVALREKLGFSQPVMANMLRVKPATLKNWEQGRSRPNSQAAILFRLIEQEPATLGKIAAL